MLTVEQEKMLEVAARIREMREISGLTVEEMANKVEVTVDDYLRYEIGDTYEVKRCAGAFNEEYYH